MQFATVATHDAMGRCEPDADAGEFVLAVQPLEGLEQLRGMRHVETGTVVGHAEDTAGSVARRFDADACVGCALGVLPRVVEQVAHHDIDHRGVAPGDEVGRNIDVHPPARVARGELFEDPGRQRGHVDAIPVQLPARAARQPQEAVDQRGHVPAAAHDLVEVAARLGIEVVAAILDECLAETGHGAQRCPQIVRDGVGETFEFLVRGRQLGSALRDPRLEGRIERADLLLGGAPFRDVADDAEHGGPAAETDAVRAQFHPEIAITIARQEAQLVLPGRFVALADARVESRRPDVEELRRDDVGEGASDELVEGVAEHRGQCRIGEHEPALLGDEDAVREGFHDGADALLALAQGLLGGAALGDVERDAADVDRRTALVEHGKLVRQEGPRDAVHRERLLDHARLSGLQHREIGGAEARRDLGRIELHIGMAEHDAGGFRRDRLGVAVDECVAALDVLQEQRAGHVIDDRLQLALAVDAALSRRPCAAACPRRRR